jgi:hypothetical protein
MERRWPAEGNPALHQADRRPDPHGQRGRHLQPVRNAGPRDPRSAAAAPDAAGREGSHRRAGRAGRQDQGLPRHPRLPRADHAIISDELAEVREKFAVPRRTEIVDWSGDMDDEDLIEREDMVVTVTQAAISSARRWPISARRSAAARACRGATEGRGRRHHPLRRQHAHAAPVLHHRRHGLQAQDLAPALGRAHVAGKAIVNILPIPQGTGIAAIMPVDRDEDDWDDLQIVFATSAGDVRRNALSAISPMSCATARSR